MFRNFLKIAFRNILRNKFFSIINILGLAIGIAICIIISLFVYDEFKYDSHTADGNRIFRVLNTSTYSNMVYSAYCSGRVLPLIQPKIPEIEEGMRVFMSDDDIVFTYNDKIFKEPNVLFVDPNFLDFFGWTKDNKPKSSTNNHQVVLSRKIATKFFGKEDPYGKVIVINNRVSCVVSEIIDDIPKYSHLKSGIIVDNSVLKILDRGSMESWGNHSQFTYIKLKQNIISDNISNKIAQFVNNERIDNRDDLRVYKLQPLSRIHLYSSGIEDDNVNNGNITSVYFFTLIALLILCLACFNYMNLFTAYASRRSKEIGIRKTVGASRKLIIIQFIIETLIISIIAVIFALILAEVFIPWFNAFSNNNISIYQVPSVLLVCSIVLLILFTTLLSGAYPAIVLSKYSPLKSLKESNSMIRLKYNNYQLRFRQVIIIFQLVITISLTIATVIINRQLSFVQNKEIGIPSEQLLVVENPRDDKSLSRFNAIRDELINSTDILGVSGAYNLPGAYINNSTYFIIINDELQEVKKASSLISIDSKHFNVLNAEIINGRDFIDNNASEKENYCIINESAMRAFGISDQPLEKVVKGFWDGRQRKVIGVVKDIHYISMHELVEPVVYYISEEWPNYCDKFVIRISPHNIESSINTINKVWKDNAHEWPLDMRFIDQKFERMYHSDKKISIQINIFSGLALFISMLGLFGLISYVINTHIKEFGVRKVLGASTIQLVLRFANEFALLTIISNILAWPFIYFILERWLQNYAFRMNFSIWYFVLVGLVVLIIVLIIVSFHAFKSALKNPVESLKYE